MPLRNNFNKKIQVPPCTLSRAVMKKPWPSHDIAADVYRSSILKVAKLLKRMYFLKLSVVKTTQINRCQHATNVKLLSKGNVDSGLTMLYKRQFYSCNSRLLTSQVIHGILNSDPFFKL